MAIAFMGSSAVLAWLLLDNRNDDAYITFRHAQNLLGGRGFVFNPGERVLGTTAPLHGLVVAASGLVSDDLPVNALVIAWLAALALALFMWRTLAQMGRESVGIIAGSLVLVSRFTYEVFPLETVLLAALIWGAIWATVRERQWAVVAFASAAVLVRADAALGLAALFAVDFLARRQLRRLVVSGLAIAGATAPWFVFAWSYYGAPLSNTAAAKTGWPGHEWFFVGRLWERGMSPLFAAESLAFAGAGVAAYGAVTVFRDGRYRLLRVVPVWMALHVLAYTAMRIFWAHHWYYYPFFLGMVFLFAVGVVDLGERITAHPSLDAPGRRRVGWLGGALLASCGVVNVVDVLQFREQIPNAFFVGGRDRLYRATAQWLIENSAEGDTVAVAEPGTLAYYSDRPMVDMMGLVTAGVGAHNKAQDRRVADFGWVTQTFEPNFVLLTWPKPRAFAGVLPEDPAYRLRHVIGVDKVDVIVLLYARAPAPAG